MAKGKGQSKNARTGSKVQVLICSACGGEIKGHTVVTKGRVTHYAECEKCHRRGYKPSHLMR